MNVYNGAMELWVRNREIPLMTAAEMHAFEEMIKERAGEKSPLLA